MPRDFIRTDAGRRDARPDERSDCGVRALAIATGRTYAEAHAALKALGRPDGQSTRCEWLTAILGVPLQPGPACMPNSTGGVRYIPGQRVTLTQWMREHPKGRFVVFTSSHFVAVIDGVAHDTGRMPRQRVNGFWPL